MKALVWHGKEDMCCPKCAREYGAPVGGVDVATPEISEANHQSGEP